jgi:putative transcriptional regulator
LICDEVLKEKYLKNLGKRIVELRLKKGWSQRDLAFECGKEPQSIERVENGKSNPTAYYLKEIADALGVSVADFFDF